MKFKVGNKVRVIKLIGDPKEFEVTEWGRLLGKTGNILEIYDDPDDPYPIRTNISSKGHDYSWVGEDEIVPYKFTEKDIWKQNSK